MILKYSVLGLTGLAAALGTAPLHADVLEVGAGGHRWIAGAPAGTAVTVDEAVALANIAAGDMGTETLSDAEVPADLAVPAAAIARAPAGVFAVPPQYQAKVAELSARFDLSPALIEALVWQESRWRSGAVSPVGARGLAQLMPATARELGVDPGDPHGNLEGGARYLRQQMDRFGGDVERALAAYNAGPGRVIRSGGIPRIRETQTYVAAIMGRLSNHSREQ